MELTVVSQDDWVTWLAMAARMGEVAVGNVVDLTYKVSLESDSNTSLISKLTIVCHGSTGGISVGTDYVSLKSLPRYENSLRKLQWKMDSRGLVHIQACDVGQNTQLLSKLARIWGVDVYAADGTENPILHFNWGQYVVCSPDGRVIKNVQRPSDPYD